MKKIIVSIFLMSLVGCASTPKSSKDPSTTIITPKEIAECNVKVDTKLPDSLDLTENKLEKIETDGDKVTLSRTEFLSIQHLLLKLKNRIYELQEIVKDSKK